MPSPHLAPGDRAKNSACIHMYAVPNAVAVSSMLMVVKESGKGRNKQRSSDPHKGNQEERKDPTCEEDRKLPRASDEA